MKFGISTRATRNFMINGGFCMEHGVAETAVSMILSEQIPEGVGVWDGHLRLALLLFANLYGLCNLRFGVVDVAHSLFSKLRMSADFE